MRGKIFRSAAAGFAFLLGLMASISAAAGEELRLEPSTRWHMKPDEASCRLLRSFGSGETLTHVSMEFYARDDSLELRIAGSPVDGHTENVNLRFDPIEDEHEEFVIRRELPNGMKMITMPNVSLGLSANRHGEIEWLEVRNAGSSDFKLHFGSMAEPMEAVGACLDKLLAGWGIDVARYRGRIRPVEPKGSPGDWVTSRDYPLVPLLNHADGIVHFLLVVGADGEPMSCHVQNSSGAKQFTHVCEVLMRRAHFEPALDAQGLPMASYFRSAVRFEIAR